MYGIVVALAISAPAPMPRPVQPVTRADVVGLWKMGWSGSHWKARFCEDGFYASWDGTTTWIGSWKLENGILTVAERMQDSSLDLKGYTWTAAMTRRKGYLDGSVKPPGPGISFQLRR